VIRAASYGSRAAFDVSERPRLDVSDSFSAAIAAALIKGRCGVTQWNYWGVIQVTPERCYDTKGCSHAF
jgi:hypothetical protein